MRSERFVTEGRLRRLTEELVEEGLVVGGGDALVRFVDEVDYALRPPVHERRIPTYGVIVDPVVDPADWGRSTTLAIARRDTSALGDEEVRRFADGMASWTVRDVRGVSELVVFDRPAGSERDLVVLAEASGGAVVQRHPAGVVRVVGPFGVARFNGFTWHVTPPVADWIARTSVDVGGTGRGTVARMLTFAVHDLASAGIGTVLVVRRRGETPGGHEIRLPAPPPLRIDRPTDLAPLRHVLGQVDGAAMFDEEGMLCKLGVRLVPSGDAERTVAAHKGTRHTAARRYSHDDPGAVVIVVSEDGPVSVWQAGELVGRSGPDEDDAP